jgi:putative FmdB family regulatory protein
MPLYEFSCPNGHHFEKFYRSIGSAQSEEKCPECGAPAVRRMSTAGLVFKGSGFYITDYGKDGKKAEREQATAKTAAAEKSSAVAEGKTAGSEGGSAKPEASPAPAKPASDSAGSPAQPASTRSSDSAKKAE